MNRLSVDMLETGKKIYTYIELNNWTVSYLASKLGLDPNTVRQYLKGRTMPKYDTLYTMKELFHLDSIEDLLVFKEKEEDNDGWNIKE